MPELSEKLDNYENYKKKNAANLIFIQDLYQLEIIDIDILYYFCVEACGRKCISDKLGISYNTVCNKLKKIFKKIGVNSCRELTSKIHNYLYIGKN